MNVYFVKSKNMLLVVFASTFHLTRLKRRENGNWLLKEFFWAVNAELKIVYSTLIFSKMFRVSSAVG